MCSYVIENRRETEYCRRIEKARRFRLSDYSRNDRCKGSESGSISARLPFDGISGTRGTPKNAAKLIKTGSADGETEHALSCWMDASADVFQTGASVGRNYRQGI